MHCRQAGAQHWRERERASLPDRHSQPPLAQRAQAGSSPQHRSTNTIPAGTHACVSRAEQHRAATDARRTVVSIAGRNPKRKKTKHSSTFDTFFRKNDSRLTVPAWLAKNPPTDGAVFSGSRPGVEPNLRRQSPPGWARHQYWRVPLSFFYPPEAAEQSKVY